MDTVALIYVSLGIAGFLGGLYTQKRKEKRITARNKAWLLRSYVDEEDDPQFQDEQLAKLPRRNQS